MSYIFHCIHDKHYVNHVDLYYLICLQCTAFVKDFAPAIIQLVDKEIDPAQLCKVRYLTT